MVIGLCCVHNSHKLGLGAKYYIIPRYITRHVSVISIAIKHLPLPVLVVRQEGRARPDQLIPCLHPSGDSRFSFRWPGLGHESMRGKLVGWILQKRTEASVDQLEMNSSPMWDAPYPIRNVVCSH